MDFALSDAQRAWQDTARRLARSWTRPDLGEQVAGSALAAGFFAADIDALTRVVVVEAAAVEHPVGAVALALQSAVAAVLSGASAGDRGRGGLVALSSEQKPTLRDGTLTGRALWMAPHTENAIAIVGAAQGDDTVACAVMLDAAGVQLERVNAAGWQGLGCMHALFDHTPCTVLGSPRPVMSHVRMLLAAAGIGMGRRAVREALRAAAAYGRTGAGGEQTVQGLLADAATEIDAAMMLVQQAAMGSPISLAQASMAKLAASEGAQRAVARAAQIVGPDSFREGHILEQLTQDARALELFAGRTEALREAVADEVLPKA